MEKINIPKGDFGFNLAFTVTDSSGTAVNIGTYTVTLQVWAVGIPDTLLLDEACTETVAASGTCYYTVQDEDFDTVGRFHAELELTTCSTIIESTEIFAITVTESG